jgi:signal transduction histidine kinase
VWLGQSLQILLGDEGFVGAQAVARDITRQREVTRMKDEFLSVVSHELRTPLTAIRGSLGLLASGRMGRLEERGQRMLEIAAQNSGRLVRLINDLLDIEKIESGREGMKREAVELARLVGEVLESLQPLAEAAGVKLEATVASPPIVADPDRILQVLTNLVSNAVKFSTPGGTVLVRAEAREKDVLVTVRDEGRGIPSDKLEAVFERFQQVDSSDAREKGGTGLGLPIARSIVQQHGGRLWAESEFGKGSTFSFTLPLGGE